MTVLRMGIVTHPTKSRVFLSSRAVPIVSFVSLDRISNSIRVPGVGRACAPEKFAGQTIEGLDLYYKA